MSDAEPTAESGAVMGSEPPRNTWRNRGLIAVLAGTTALSLAGLGASTLVKSPQQVAACVDRSLAEQGTGGRADHHPVGGTADQARGRNGADRLPWTYAADSDGPTLTDGSVVS